MISYQAQLELLRSVMTEEKVARELSGVLHAGHLGNPAVGYLVEAAIDCYRRFGQVATEGQLRDAISDGNLNPSIRMTATQRLSDALTADCPPPDHAIALGRKIAAGAILRALDLDSVERSGDYDKLLAQVKAAAVLASPQGEVTRGGGTEDDVTFRHRPDDQAVPTGLEGLDTILGGGLQRGRLGHVLAVKGGGKSHTLRHFGAHALKTGLRVFDVTLEMPEWETRARYDRNLTGLTREECYLDPGLVLSATADIHDRLSVMEATSRSLTVHAIEAAIEREPEEPDLLLIDYPRLMTSGGKFGGDVGRAVRADMTAVSIGIRRLAQKLHIPTWVPYHANRVGAQKLDSVGNQPLDKTDYAECYDVNRDADVIISLNQSIAEAGSGIGRIFVAENRGGSCRKIVLSKFDWARSRLEDWTEAA